MSVLRPSVFDPTEAKRSELIARREIYLAQWRQDFLNAGGECHWDVMPTIDTTCGTWWHMVPAECTARAYRDQWRAFIRGERLEIRYFRAVECTTRELQSGEGNRKLVETLMAVQVQGPSTCVAVEDGGLLPNESDCPPLQGNS